MKYFHLCFLLLMLTGCSPRKLRGDKNLNLHIPVRLTHLDPHKMEDAYSMLANIQIYRGLFRFLGNGELKPDLIHNYEINKERTKYIFHLKKDAKFSNGDDITSNNVLHSLARIYFLGSSIGADLDYITGLQLFKKTKNIDDLGIKVIDDKTFSITLLHPTNIFIKHLATADCAILPIRDFKTTQLPLIFSGPYQISSTGPDFLEISKWRKDDFDSKSPPLKIRFFFTEDSVQSLVDRNQTDWIVFDHISQKTKDQLKIRGWFHTSGELSLENFLIINPEYYDLATRKKLYSIIYPMNLIDKIPFEGLERAYGLIPPIFNGFLTKNESESIWDLTKNISSAPKELIIEYNSDVEITTKTAMILSEELIKNGLKVKLIPLKAEALLEIMFAKKGHIILGRKGIDYPDSISILNGFVA